MRPCALAIELARRPHSGRQGDFDPAYDRFGSECEELDLSVSGPLLPPKAYVRAHVPVGRVRARKRHMQCSKIAAYSITSSARTKNVSEIARPIVLAVFTLTMSSNFVGCSMGRSAGLAPLRMRSTKYAARRYKLRIFTP
jgi:hypothetical protein